MGLAYGNAPRGMFMARAAAPAAADQAFQRQANAEMSVGGLRPEQQKIAEFNKDVRYLQNYRRIDLQQQWNAQPR